MHDPPWQMSGVVHWLPSSQDAVLSVWTQVPDALQLSSVQGFVSAQSLSGPGWQEPPEHTSPTVQALPSSHVAVLFVCVQVPPAQLSSVQGLLSLQVVPVPWHEPPEHTSSTVQGSPSSHDAVLGVKTHCPDGELQASSVHPLPSSQRAELHCTVMVVEQSVC